MLVTAIAILALLYVLLSLFPRLCLYITLGVFGLTSFAEVGLLLCYNVTFTHSKDKKKSTVGEIFKYLVNNDNLGNSNKSPVQVTIIPKEPLEMKARQYVNVCIPSLGLRFPIQSHLFVVTSWTSKLQTKLELVIKPRHS